MKSHASLVALFMLLGQTPKRRIMFSQSELRLRPELLVEALSTEQSVLARTILFKRAFSHAEGIVVLVSYGFSLKRARYTAPL